jgi:hypothetical protein
MSDKAPIFEKAADKLTMHPRSHEEKIESWGTLAGAFLCFS